MNKRETPPTGWVFIERSTGQKFSADSYAMLVAKVREHREYKGLDVDATEQDVQDQICLTLGTPVCRRDPGDPPQITDQTNALTYDMLMSFNKAVFAEIGAGGAVVEKSETERRAEICRRCPLNKSKSQCSCSPFYKLIDLLVPKSRREPGLEVCMACGCSLAAKVLLPLEVVQKSIPEGTEFPEWCWQRGTNEGHLQ